MTEEQFAAVAQILSEDSVKRVEEIKKFCITSEICSYEDFMRGYEDETKTNAEEAKTDSSLDASCSIASFRELFQSFEHYPSNLRKPKKQPVIDHDRSVVNRTRLSMGSSRTSSVEQLVDRAALLDKWDKGPNAAKIYTNYRKSLKILKQLQQWQKDDLEGKYMEALAKINELAKQVEKLQDEQLAQAEIAFTAEDANVLGQFVVNFEKALFVAENRELFKQGLQNEENAQNLLNIINLLEYFFECVQ